MTSQQRKALPLVSFARPSLLKDCHDAADATVDATAFINRGSGRSLRAVPPRSGPVTRRFPKVWLPRLAVLGAVLLAVFGIATARLFLWPRDTHTRLPRDSADAVVVFADGRSERLDAALALMKSGVAPTLVIPNGRASGSYAGDAQCNQPQPWAVVCSTVNPDTTKGEAENTAALAATQGWRHVVLVTSTDDAVRARLLIERCYTGTVTVVDAADQSSLPSRLANIGHAWIRWLSAELVTRDC